MRVLQQKRGCYNPAKLVNVEGDKCTLAPQLLNSGARTKQQLEGNCKVAGFLVREREIS